MTTSYDFTYEGYCSIVRKYVVREQFYPECRGWLNHQFDTEVQARAWLAEKQIGGHARWRN